MGFSHALVAVHDLPPAEVAARLGCGLSDQVTDLETATTRRTPGWCVSEPVGGWTYVVDKTWAVLGDERGLARLSAGTRLLTFHVEEHVMSFATTCWGDGAYEWQVMATAEENELYVIGEPPALFNGLVGELETGDWVVAGLDEATGPPRELWEDLEFDPSTLPSARAAAQGLAVRRARPGGEFEGHPYLPAVELFARLTGHTYDGDDALHSTVLRVLTPQPMS